LCIFSSEIKSQEASIANYNGYRETIWLESDRHLFLSGEDIRFKAQVLEQDTYNKSFLSQSLRVELIDPTGISVIQQNLQLNKAGLNGKLQLPEDAKTGWYYLRAYTNWMRNFPVSEYGLLPIKVVNPNNVNLDSIQNNHDQPIQYEQNKLEYLLVEENDHSLFVTFSDQNSAKNEKMRLLLHQSYTILWDSDRSDHSETRFIIPKNILPTGIMQLSLLGEDGRIITKRLWSDYHPEYARISISPREDIFRIRNSYSLDLSQIEINNDYSVLIALNEPSNPMNKYIPGLPGWNCNSTIPGDSLAFKKWLLSNSYSDELVQSISGSSQNKNLSTHLKHLPETRAGVIYGQVINKKTGLGSKDTGVCLNILNDNYYDATSTDSESKFYFALPGYSGSIDYILNLTAAIDSSLQIEVTPLFDLRQNSLLNNFTLSDEELEYLYTQSINLQIQRIYQLQPEPDNHSSKPYTIKKPFFHPPDYTVILDDFIKLANIREVIYELVPNVVARKKNGLEYLKVYNDHPFLIDYETLVLLDGIPITNTQNLLDLPPDRIELIEVKDKLYIHGRTIFSAIINFVSPNKDYAGLELPDNSVLSTFDLPEIIDPIQLSKPEGEPNLPQLSNTLLWESDISLPLKSVRFNTNDLTGIFQISVYGFDNNGNWIFGNYLFDVSN